MHSASLANENGVKNNQSYKGSLFFLNLFEVGLSWLLMSSALPACRLEATTSFCERKVSYTRFGRGNESSSVTETLYGMVKDRFQGLDHLISPFYPSGPGVRGSSLSLGNYFNWCQDRKGSFEGKLPGARGSFEECCWPSKWKITRFYTDVSFSHSPRIRLSMNS